MLAYNIGLLVLAAVNSPSKYPRTPAEAFGSRPAPAPDGGKADFMRIAEQLNRRFGKQE
jgi:hypothetical protein